MRILPGFVLSNKAANLSDYSCFTRREVMDKYNLSLALQHKAFELVPATKS